MSNYSGNQFRDDDTNSSWYKIFKMIPEKSKVLDVGCSSGTFGQELVRRKKCVVDGIELDEQDFKEASKKLRNMYNLNIENDNIDVITDKYDFVYFGDVIEHLVSPVFTLGKIKQLLKPDGKVLFSIPNMTNVAVRLALLKGDFEYTETGVLDNTHLHFYSLTEVQRIFTEANLKIEKLDFVEKDYPSSLIQKWLKGLGLTANEKFYDEMRKPDAAAFQFVGCAVPAKNLKVKKRQVFSPISLFEEYHSSVVEDMNNIIEDVKQDASKVRERMNDLEKENQKLINRNQQHEVRWKNLKENPTKFILKKIKDKL